MTVDPITVTSADGIMPSNMIGRPRKHVQQCFGLLATCQRVYHENCLLPLQLNPLTSKFHLTYDNLDHYRAQVVPVNDKLLWMSLWQRQIVPKVHIHMLIVDPHDGQRMPGAAFHAVMKSIDTLSFDLTSMKVMHISIWEERRSAASIAPSYLSEICK
jgi:hypothetical protein